MKKLNPKFRYKRGEYVSCRHCRISGHKYIIHIPEDEYNKFRGGLSPFEAFKYILSVDEMGLVTTGFTRKEWESIYGEESTASI